MLTKERAAALLILSLLACPHRSWSTQCDRLAPHAPMPGSTSRPDARCVDDWDCYVNEGYGFRICYPPTLAPSFDGLPGRSAECTVVIFMPNADPSIDEFGQSTNLFGYWITIAVSESTMIPSAGAVTGLSGERWPGDELCSEESLSFTRTSFSEGAAGNRYETILLAAVSRSRTYEIRLVIHSGNPGCYAPGTITTFDRAPILRLLDEMVATFSLAGGNR